MAIPRFKYRLFTCIFYDIKQFCDFLDSEEQSFLYSTLKE